MWFGEIAVFDGLPRTHDAVAAEKSAVLHVPAQALDRILEGEPRYWRELGLLVASKLRLAFLAMEDSAVLPIADRLARRLLVSVERYGEWHDRTSRVVDLRQQELATMLSTSRQTVNQLLKELEDQGDLAALVPSHRDPRSRSPESRRDGRSPGPAVEGGKARR